jgi:hypothetical protein
MITFAGQGAALLSYLKWPALRKLERLGRKAVLLYLSS